QRDGGPLRHPDRRRADRSALAAPCSDRGGLPGPRQDAARAGKVGALKMAKRTPLGWVILAVIVLAIALLVNIPVALLTLAFVSGAPLFTIMLGAAVLGAMSLPRSFDAEFGGMSASMLPLGLGDQAEVMSTIPLFIFAGYLLAESGAAARLVNFANAALGWVPGGLAIVT